MKYSEAQINRHQHIRQIHLDIEVLKLQIMQKISCLWVIPNIHSQVVPTITDNGTFELDDAFELGSVSEEQKDYQSVDADDEVAEFQLQEWIDWCRDWLKGCSALLEEELVIDVRQQVN